MQNGAKRTKTAEDDSGVTKARTRVSRACAETVCVYDTATKKRGLPEGYVRAIEKLWAVSFSRIEGLEDLLISTLQQDRPLLTSIWNHREVGEELHSKWKDSRVFSELETFLTGVEAQTAAAGSKRKRDHEDDEDNDHIGDLATILPTKYALCDKEASGEVSLSRRTLTMSTISLPTATSEILGRYFGSIHAYFPILDRPKVLRSCYEQTRGGTQISHDNDDLAVLAAAMACTTKLGGLGEPDSLPTSLFDIARQCIPGLSGAFKIGHVQALLLLALSDIHTGAWESAWRSVGLAARVLTDLSEKTGQVTRDQTAARQGCLILDTLVGIRLRRRPQCRRDDLPSDAFLHEDGNEEWEPWQGTSEPAFIISCFNNLTKLSGILSDFVCQLPGTPIPARDRTEQALGNLNTLAGAYPRGARLTAADVGPPHQTFLKVAHLLTLAYVTASHPDHVNSTIPPLAAAKKSLDDAELAAGVIVVPSWLTGLYTGVIHEMNELQSGIDLISSIKHASMFKALDEHLGGSPQEAERNLLVVTRDTVAGSIIDPSLQPLKRNGSTSLARRSFFPADPFAQPMNVMTNQSPPITTAGPDAANNVFERTPQDFWNSSIDVPTAPAMVPNGGLVMPATHGSLPTVYNPSIATSPSFQGDEIDALFHEMAQLDTTEWATGRNQGLKDFGFNDMQAFEEFCNDPDRVFSSNAEIETQQPMPQRHMSDLTMADFDQQNFDMAGLPIWNG
ncbi:Quinic acid utilization activator [Cyphellophora attinorum]|uniref:Quinic acid utilization activator n=1 Tax=Cyphellophora attinorum TaxID=1664694 RepID=A0A0N1HJP3_9EURO|nr:Quinic acid utilization activator [Phialophora attinorum]KPI36743.1 Quinic acid utilization activator [Phialophora attinorum]